MHQYSDETKDEAYRRTWLEDSNQEYERMNRNRPHQPGLIEILIGLIFKLAFGILKGIFKMLFGKK